MSVPLLEMSASRRLLRRFGELALHREMDVGSAAFVVAEEAALLAGEFEVPAAAVAAFFGDVAVVDDLHRVEAAVAIDKFLHAHGDGLGIEGHALIEHRLDGFLRGWVEIANADAGGVVLE